MKEGSPNKPSEIDYCVYFIYQLLVHMCKDNRFVLNKYKYSTVYYDIQNVIFWILNTDQTTQIIKNYSDFQDYHVDWIKSMINDHSFKLRAVSIHF